MVSTNWSLTTKRLVIIGLIVLLLIGLYLSRALLPPIILGVVLAFLLKPVVDSVERRAKVPRTAAAMLVFLVTFLLLSLIPVTVVPYAVERIARLNLDMERLVDDLTTFLSRPVTVYTYTFELQDLVGDVRGTLTGLLQPFASQTVTLLVNVASSLLWVVTVLVIAFYLSRDAARLRAFLDRIPPPGYADEIRRLREEINLVWKAFFQGQVVLGIVIGLAVWIAMTAVGLPNAGLMGLLAGLLEVIPNFGPILATFPAVVIAFIRGSTYLPLSNFWFAVLVLGIYVVIQQTENAYLVPRIIGRRLQLPPVIVFVGLLVGGALAGILGVFLASPILGTLRVLLRYLYAKLFDQPPFPPKAAEEGGEIYPGEIDAILFDLDGTLVETDNAAVESLAHRLTPLRRILPGRDPRRAARHILGGGEEPASRILALLDRVGLDSAALGLGGWLRRRCGLKSATHLQPVDGTVEMLHDLSRRYYLAIVTTRCHQEAQAFLRQQQLAGLFQAITGRDDTWRIKPHPSPIRHTAERLGVVVERCLMVGDTSVDIMAARAAGAQAAGVLCGFGDRKELERAGAQRIMETTSDLAEWM